MGKHMVHPVNNEAKPKKRVKFESAFNPEEEVEFSIEYCSEVASFDANGSPVLEINTNNEDEYYWSSYGVNSVCKHSWVTYVGIYDSFDYCEKCEEKKKKDE